MPSVPLFRFISKVSLIYRLLASGFTRHVHIEFKNVAIQAELGSLETPPAGQCVNMVLRDHLERSTLLEQEN